jgi:hypothetical protein
MQSRGAAHEGEQQQDADATLLREQPDEPVHRIDLLVYSRYPIVYRRDLAVYVIDGTCHFIDIFGDIFDLTRDAINDELLRRGSLDATLPKHLVEKLPGSLTLFNRGRDASLGCVLLGWPSPRDVPDTKG